MTTCTCGQTPCCCYVQSITIVPTTPNPIVISAGQGGAIGAQGVQGIQGSLGVTGGQGVQGTQGAGAPGTQGTLGTQGAQGAVGAGTQGVQGTQGTTPAIAYLYVKGTPSSTWVIVHNLNFYPNVTVQDSGGSIVEGEITYTNSNSLTATFSAAFSGTAYLS